MPGTPPPQEHGHEHQHLLDNYSDVMPKGSSGTVLKGHVLYLYYKAGCQVPGTVQQVKDTDIGFKTTHCLMNYCIQRVVASFRKFKKLGDARVLQIFSGVC